MTLLICHWRHLAAKPNKYKLKTLSTRQGFFLPQPPFPLYMVVLHFTFGDSPIFFLTLQELVTLDSPAYLFVFTQRAVNKVVAVVLTPDESTARADRFTLDVSTVFEDCPTGQYSYQVYEQSDADNLEPANAGAELERGMMQLYPAAPFVFTQREAATHFIQPAT